MYSFATEPVWPWFSRNVSEHAERLMELFIAEPSELRSTIAAALVDALLPCRTILAELLPVRLKADGKLSQAIKYQTYDCCGFENAPWRSLWGTNRKSLMCCHPL